MILLVCLIISILLLVGYFHCSMKWKYCPLFGKLWTLWEYPAVSKYWHVTKHAVPVQVSDLMSLYAELWSTVVLQLVASRVLLYIAVVNIINSKLWISVWNISFEVLCCWNYLIILKLLFTLITSWQSVSSQWDVQETSNFLSLSFFSPMARGDQHEKHISWFSLTLVFLQV